MTMNTNGLAKLFSDENKANYERIAKPQEYIRRKRSLNDGDGKISSDDTTNENNDQIPQNKIKKIKKPKHKHSKQIQINNTNSNEQETPTIPSSVEEVSNEKDERTIFVGNIPITENVNSLKSYFGQFGPVESVRLRSVPIAGTAVDEHGNQDLVKKVCVNKGKFGDQKGSFNAYIVFKNKGSVQVALSANNRVLGNRHLRVDSINPTLYPPKTSVFLGGLPFYIDEEELREYFAKVALLSFF